MSNFAEKLTQIAEKEAHNVELNQQLEQIMYGTDTGGEGWYDKLYDESKIVKKTVTGNNLIALDDVSEVPHNVEVEADSECTIKVCGKNLLDISSYTKLIGPWGELTSTDLVIDGDLIYVKYDTYSGSAYLSTDKPFLLPPGTYTFSGKCKDSTLSKVTCGVKYADGSRYAPAINIKPESEGWYTFRFTFSTTTNKTISGIYLQDSGGTAKSNICFTEIQLAVVDDSSYQSYQSYQEEEYKTVNGKATIPSNSPYMTLMTDGANLTINYRKSYGMQTCYDRFWDIWQTNGSRTNYNYRFYAWHLDLFYPKYDIIVAYDGTSIFHFAGGADGVYSKCDMIDRLKECGVTLDVSGAKSGDYVFYGTGFTTLPTLDYTGLTVTRYLWYTFAQNQYLKKIEKLKVLEKTTYGHSFDACPALEEIEFEGVIGNDINFGDCKVLNKSSQTNIIEHLSTTATGKTVTFSKTAVNNAFGIDVDDPTTYPEGSEFYELRNSKSNWTFAYK